MGLRVQLSDKTCSRVTDVWSAIRNLRTQVPDGPKGDGSALILPTKMMFKQFPHLALVLFA